MHSGKDVSIANGATKAKLADSAGKMSRRTVFGIAVGAIASAALISLGMLGLSWHHQSTVTDEVSAPPATRSEKPLAAEAPARATSSTEKTYRATSSKDATLSTLSIEVALQGWQPDVSTPLLAHVSGTDRNGTNLTRFYALGSGVTDIDLPAGRYQIEYAEALNSDGSIYEHPAANSVLMGIGGLTIEVSPELVPANTVTAEQLKAATRRVESFVKSAPDDAFDGGGFDILARAYRNAAQAKQNGETADRKAQTTTEPPRAAKSATFTKEVFESRTTITTISSGSAAESASSGSAGNSVIAPVSTSDDATRRKQQTRASDSATSSSNTSAKQEEKRSDNQGAPGRESGRDEATRVFTNPPIADDEDDEDTDASTDIADKVWMDEAGHYENRDGNAEWVADIPAHWE